ncbi:MAG TPA: alpha-ketoacid dehydrogenase subunit beta [Chloroflexota bacterium]|nr:alpha-ketoacid dehydrogenase subunit beta [Chloroflexota bacterium]
MSQPATTTAPEAADRRVSLVVAINQALREEMARDPAVYVLGEDVAVGGPFGATAGLAELYGEGRVRNTPISEGSIMGTAVGMAVLGLRPVVEIMFVDFITLAMDQLVNHAAKLHYLSGGQLRVPLVVRAQCGVMGGWGAHHSQSLEAWFVHVPGLKVVMPATPADARGLLKAAIRDDNPVVFVENRALYWGLGDVPPGEGLVPLGQAAVRQAGGDVTVLATGRLVGEALAAARDLTGEGIAAEVIDLRSLVPLDLDSVLASVRKTGRVVVAHEAVLPGGYGAELTAQVQRAAFDYLDAPIERVGAPFAPVPASPSLEAAFLPGRAEVAAAVRAALGRR